MGNKLGSATRVMSGTYTEIWLDGELVAEAYKFQAKKKFNKEKIHLCGEQEVDTKIVSTEGTGSIGMYEVNSRMSIVVGEMVQAGRDPRFTLVSKLADPDAFGAKRVALHNVSFDDETIADWEVGKPGKVEAPFTFTKRELLDYVAPQ